MREEPIGKLIARINNGFHRKLHHSPLFCQVQGMTGKNGWLIAFLSMHQGQPVYQRDLEKEFNITRSTASRVISLMEKKGFVVRHGVEGDARLKEIALTEKALEVVEKVQQENDQLEAELTKGFSEAELAQLTGYLQRILDNIGQADAEETFPPHRPSKYCTKRG